MARTFVQEGNTIDAVAGVGGVKSGDVVILGALVGIAEVDAAEGATYALALTGVHKLAKAAGAGINAGAKTYWVTAAKNCTATADSHTLLGACVETVGTDATSVLVRLNGTTAP